MDRAQKYAAHGLGSCAATENQTHQPPSYSHAVLVVFALNLEAKGGAVFFVRIGLRKGSLAFAFSLPSF